LVLQVDYELIQVSSATYMFFFQNTTRKELASRACKARNVIKLTNKVENWFLLLCGDVSAHDDAHNERNKNFKKF